MTHKEKLDRFEELLEDNGIGIESVHTISGLIPDSEIDNITHLIQTKKLTLEKLSMELTKKYFVMANKNPSLPESCRKINPETLAGFIRIYITWFHLDS